MIRPMQDGDLPLYKQMSLEFYATDAVDHPLPETHFDSIFREVLSDGPYLDGYFLLNAEGIEVGYAIVSKMMAVEAGGLCVWVEDLYIRASFRGQGLGTEFFRFIKEKYPTAGRFRLEVERDNLPAVRLYKKQGFDFLHYDQMICDVDSVTS